MTTRADDSPSLMFAPSEGAVATPSAPSSLIPVAKSKTYTSKDGNVSEKIRLDVNNYTLNAIRELMVRIAVDEIEQQLTLDNPPAFAEVDGMRGRGIADAQRRLTISFGNRLKISALRALENALIGAISASTEKRTGTLLSGWKWTYVRNGRSESLPLGGASGIPMGPRDMLILAPKDVKDSKGRAYATAVNMRVAGGGKLSFRRSKNGRVNRKNQSIGFLALAARSAKTSALFGGFNVTANFTTRYAVQGEVVKKGGGPRTGYLKITPKGGKRRG